MGFERIIIRFNETSCVICTPALRMIVGRVGFIDKEGKFIQE